jgi:hypothetical protein
MVSASQRAIVAGHVESAVAAGATLLHGGGATTDATDASGGYFYPATLLSNVPYGARFCAFLDCDLHLIIDLLPTQGNAIHRIATSCRL